MRASAPPMRSVCAAGLRLFRLRTARRVEQQRRLHLRRRQEFRTFVRAAIWRGAPEKRRFVMFGAVINAAAASIEGVARLVVKASAWGRSPNGGRTSVPPSLGLAQAVDCVGRRGPLARS
jgi:hypothetical protein